MTSNSSLEKRASQTRSRQVRMQVPAWFRGGLVFKAHWLCVSRMGENNLFTEMCRGFEAGSYLRIIDFVYHSTLGSRVKMKKKSTARACPPALTYIVVLRNFGLEMGKILASTLNAAKRMAGEIRLYAHPWGAGSTLHALFGGNSTLNAPFWRKIKFARN